MNRLEREALEIVASGTSRLGQIFVEVSKKEARPFLGDTFLWRCLDELAGGTVPLLTLEGPGPLIRPLWDPLQQIGQWKVGITQAGRDVLTGKADYVRLNGIDRWLGGVHLKGKNPAWHWDDAMQCLVTVR